LTNPIAISRADDVPSTRPSSSAHRAAYFSLQSTAAAKQVHNTLTLIRLQAPGTLQ
jgi:hypothetical protein